MSHEYAFIVLVLGMALMAFGLAAAVVTIMGSYEKALALRLALAGRAPGTAARSPVRIVARLQPTTSGSTSRASRRAAGEPIARP